MSASPTRDTDAEPEVAQDSTDGGDQQGEPEGGGATAREIAMYETEVKEQDRWLPIANGMLSSTYSRLCFMLYEIVIPVSMSMLLLCDHVYQTARKCAISI